MKTIYMRPSTKVYSVDVQQLMVVSNGDGGVVNSVGMAGSDYDGEDVLGRRGGSIWDDDED